MAVTASVRFETNHVARDFGDGALSVVIAATDDARGQTVYDRVTFSVPPDFHAHNDAVAAALLTLVGRRYAVVTFNFPISDYCATTLRDYYGLAEIGPVDASLEPRRPGRWIGLNFSGGFDSVALWCILNHRLGLAFKTITSDYGRSFAHERTGYAAFPRDVTCATDLRDRGFDVNGRFNAAVPLLYADYLDLASLASAHTIRHTADDAAELSAGLRPSFLDKAAAYRAGGLEELHLCRGINTLGMLKIVFAAAPEHLEGALAASAPRWAEKAQAKALMLRRLYQQAGQPEPDWLAATRSPPRRPAPPGPAWLTLRVLFAAKHFGPEVADRLLPGAGGHDYGFLADLSLDFMGRHNPNYVPYLPDGLRDALLDAYHHYGVYPFTERDWRELRLANEFIARVRARAAA